MSSVGLAQPRVLHVISKFQRSHLEACTTQEHIFQVNLEGIERNKKNIRWFALDTIRYSFWPPSSNMISKNSLKDGIPQFVARQEAKFRFRHYKFDAKEKD